MFTKVYLPWNRVLPIMSPLVCVVLKFLVLCCSPPCHPTAETMTLYGVLDENEKSAQDLGEPTPISFAWDTKIYTANQGPEPEPEPDLFLGGGGVGAVKVGAVERVKRPGED